MLAVVCHINDHEDGINGNGINLIVDSTDNNVSPISSPATAGASVTTSTTAAATTETASSTVSPSTVNNTDGIQTQPKSSFESTLVIDVNGKRSPSPVHDGGSANKDDQSTLQQHHQRPDEASKEVENHASLSASNYVDVDTVHLSSRLPV